MNTFNGKLDAVAMGLGLILVLFFASIFFQVQVDGRISLLPPVIRFEELAISEHLLRRTLIYADCC